VNAATPFVDAQPVLVNASRFRAAHEHEWQHLDKLITRMEKRSIGALSDDDLLALPLLYRTTLSSLSVARQTSLDRALVGYLEQLCTRAYFQIYGVQNSAWRQIGGFFGRGWPVAVQALWKETVVAFLLTVAGALAAYLMVRHDPSSYYTLIPGGMAEGRDPSASVEALRKTLHGHGEAKEDGLAVFAAFLFTHNAQIAIFAFALGFAFAVPTVLLILYNGLMLGAMIDSRNDRDFLDHPVGCGGDAHRHGDRFSRARDARRFGDARRPSGGDRHGGRGGDADGRRDAGRDRAAGGRRYCNTLRDRADDAGGLAGLFLSAAEARWPGLGATATSRRARHRCGAASSRRRASTCSSTWAARGRARRRS
jgi:hypothetical protein